MIAIIDYGAGNLRSISRALEANGAEVSIMADPQSIRSADRIVLPGVGNAKAAMQRLHESGIAAAVNDTVAEGTPLLGVCLGMQLLFGEQEEGPTTGLGLLQGSAKRIRGDLKVPHMGWNTVAFAPGSPLAELPSMPFYFVHSYVVHPLAESDIAATTVYGAPFPSIVIRDNVWGTQFHPEKSGESGIRLLETWLHWSP